MNEKDPIERELRNLLSVDPSPGFHDRVRAHISRQPKALPSNFRWAFAAAAAVAAIAAAVLVFPPRRGAKPDVAVTASRSILPSPAPVVGPLPTPPRGGVAKPVKRAQTEEPRLIIADNEISAMHRLLRGEITELPRPFHPEVKEFIMPETVIEALPQPAAITIDPIEPPAPAGQ